MVSISVYSTFRSSATLLAAVAKEIAEIPGIGILHDGPIAWHAESWPDAFPATPSGYAATLALGGWPDSGRNRVLVVVSGKNPAERRIATTLIHDALKANASLELEEPVHMVSVKFQPTFGSAKRRVSSRQLMPDEGFLSYFVNPV